MKRTFLLVLAFIALVISACTSGAAPSAAGKSPSTGRATSAAQPAQSVTGASALQGTWHSPQITEPEFVGWYEAAGGTAEDPNGTKYASVTAAADAFFATTGARQYAVLTLTFQSGQFALFESGDGQPAVLGDTETYTVTGNQLTMVETGSVPCTNTYTYQVSGRQLRLRILRQCTNFGFQQTTLYASFPYTKVS